MRNKTRQYVGLILTVVFGLLFFGSLAIISFDSSLMYLVYVAGVGILGVPFCLLYFFIDLPVQNSEV